VTLNYNARKDEIRDNITRMRHEWKARSMVVTRAPEWMFLMTREQYLRQAASLHRTGHNYLAVQFENLFNLRTDYVESPPLTPDR
jgi:hypothetical protein